MSSRTYGAEEKAKLERLVNEGVTVLQEIEDLNSGLKDTVKAVAEELNIKPTLSYKKIVLLTERTKKFILTMHLEYLKPLKKNNWIIK